MEILKCTFTKMFPVIVTTDPYFLTWTSWASLTRNVQINGYWVGTDLVQTKYSLGTELTDLLINIHIIAWYFSRALLLLNGKIVGNVAREIPNILGAVNIANLYNFRKFTCRLGGLFLFLLFHSWINCKLLENFRKYFHLT